MDVCHNLYFDLTYTRTSNDQSANIVIIKEPSISHIALSIPHKANSFPTQDVLQQDTYSFESPTLYHWSKWSKLSSDIAPKAQTNKNWID